MKKVKMKSNKNLIVCASVCECVLVAQLCPTLCGPMDIAHRAPLSMGFSRWEYWNGLPFPSPGIFRTQGSNLGLLQTLYCLIHQGSPKNKTKQKILIDLIIFLKVINKECVAHSRQSVNTWWTNEWQHLTSILEGSMRGCKKSEL